MTRNRMGACSVSIIGLIMAGSACNTAVDADDPAAVSSAAASGSGGGASSSASSGSGGGSTTNPHDDLPEGGQIRMAVGQSDVVVGSVAGHAELFEMVEPEDWVIPEHLDKLPTDTCVNLDDLFTQGPQLTDLRPLEVGNTIMLTDGANQFPLVQPEDDDPNTILFHQFVAPQFTEPSQLAGAELEVSWGQDPQTLLEETLLIPAPPALTYPMLTAPADLSDDATIKWTPGAGHRVYARFATFSTMQIHICVSDDDGELTIPDDVIAAIEDESFMNIGSYVRRTLDLNGRRVSLVGEYDVLYAYRK